MKKVPLLDLLRSFHSKVSFENVLIIGCQHILETTHSMFQTLFELGLSPKNVFLIGKCYSTNKSVWEEMLNDGINVSELCFNFDPFKCYDAQFKEIINIFLSKIFTLVDFTNYKRIVILDDGGQLISSTNELLKDIKNIVAIEQTTSGYEKIKLMDLRFPVINVARCKAKLILESPLIAETVLKKAINRINKLEKSPNRILILGKGAIGSAIETVLKNRYDVSIYDKIFNDHNSYINNLRNADLVIGCTGETSVSKEHHKFLKDYCVLFSASSSDREFDAVYLRKNVSHIVDCHQDVRIDGRILLNCGFPINFDGKRNSVPPSKIQLTRALLMTAIIQAVELTKPFPFIVSLDDGLQSDVVTQYLKITKTTSKNSMEIISKLSESDIR
jgi:S-adenosylhomocysteine hydrolase